MEASQGDPTVVRYLYRRGLEANPRSRFTYLSWALFEKKQGSIENAKALLKQGHQLNPRDPAILQVSSLTDVRMGCCSVLLSKQKGGQEVVCCSVHSDAATCAVMSCLYRYQQTAAFCKHPRAS